MKKLKHESQLTVPVKVVYEVLPPIEVHGSRLPLQVELSHVLVEITDSKGTTRETNLLRSLDESTIMMLEDEILTHLGVT